MRMLYVIALALLCSCGAENLVSTSNEKEVNENTFLWETTENLTLVVNATEMGKLVILDENGDKLLSSSIMSEQTTYKLPNSIANEKIVVVYTNGNGSKTVELDVTSLNLSVDL